MGGNIDPPTVADFGKEWEAFDQSSVPETELQRSFEYYFAVFPWESLPDNAVGADIGCGSGRWAKFVAPRVGLLHCIDPSERALNVARQNLRQFDNCRFHCCSVDEISLPDNSLDFAYSLGVLHHVPDTEAGIASCVSKLKGEAPLLLYMYYSFENQPRWYRWIWKVSDLLRRAVCNFPFWAKVAISQSIAVAVYYPFARASVLWERLGGDVKSIPLSAYRRRSFYSMRTDALDRFGTRVEKRFDRAGIHGMMTRSGLEGIVFSKSEPYWCVVGYKSGSSPETESAAEPL